MILNDLSKIAQVFGMFPLSSGNHVGTSESTSKIMIIDVENFALDELDHLITWIRGGQISRSGGSPSGKSGSHLSPGGE